jgi:hypothetical protein
MGGQETFHRSKNFAGSLGVFSCEPSVNHYPARNSREKRRAKRDLEEVNICQVRLPVWTNYYHNPNYVEE